MCHHHQHTFWKRRVQLSKRKEIKYDQICHTTCNRPSDTYMRAHIQSRTHMHTRTHLCTYTHTRMNAHTRAKLVYRNSGDILQMILRCGDIHALYSVKFKRSFYKESDFLYIQVSYPVCICLPYCACAFLGDFQSGNSMFYRCFSRMSD
jgi:hypothetical protein